MNALLQDLLDAIDDVIDEWIDLLPALKDGDS